MGLPKVTQPVNGKIQLQADPTHWPHFPVRPGSRAGFLSPNKQNDIYASIFTSQDLGFLICKGEAWTRGL